MIIRISHQKNYTCIANAAIRDKRLSLKARGLHHLLLSYPDGWQVKIEHLVTESDKDGRTAIASGLRELEDCGYLTRQQTRDPKTGRLGDWETVISEYPSSPESRDRDDCDRVSRKQKTRKRKTRNQETCDIINTNSKQVSKEEISISPLPPPSIAEPEEGEDSDLEIEIEEPTPQLPASLPKKLESFLQTDNHLSGPIIAAARENNSLSCKVAPLGLCPRPHFPLPQTIKPNGSEQFPWEQIDSVKGWVVEEGFLKYLSAIIKNYSQFKDLSPARLAREAVNYANKAHFGDERKCKLLGYWQDYLSESEALDQTPNTTQTPDTTLAYALVQDELRRQQEQQIIRASNKDIPHNPQVLDELRAKLQSVLTAPKVPRSRFASSVDFRAVEAQLKLERSSSCTAIKTI